MIDELIAKGKNALLVLGLAGLVGCSTTYARRDYNQYPTYSREIALFNMREISKDICGKKAFGGCFSYCDSMIIDEEGISYAKVDYNLFYVNGRSSCDSSHTRTTTNHLSWSQLRKVIPGSRSIKACQEGGECVEIVKFDDEQQANDFAEAMSIYAEGNPR